MQVATLILALGLNTPAQDNENPISWSLKASIPSNALRPGDKFTMLLTAKISEGWHLYSPEQLPGGPIPTRIDLPVNQPFKLADAIDLPVPKTEIDPNFNLETQFYEDEAIFSLPVAVVPGAPGGKHEVNVNVSYQTCNDKRCLPLKLVKLSVEVSIEGPASATTATSTNAPPKPPSAASTPTPVAADSALGVGAQVPDFAFTDFAGKARKFSEFRGKYVLLDFWATWCSPCLADMPRLRKLYDKYQPNGFEILGLDSETLGQDTDETDLATQEQAKKVAAAKGAVWTHATSPTATPVAHRIFNVESLPSKILVDREGRIIAFVKEKDDLDAMLAGLLAAK